MSSRNRQSNPNRYRAQLRFPSGLSGPGFFTIWLQTGEKVTATFESRLARVMRLLREARSVDAQNGVPGEARGWRSRQWLTEQIQAETEYPVGLGTVTAYAVMIRRAVSDVVFAASPDETVDLVEHRPKLGMRLASSLDLDVIDGAA